MWWSKTIVLVKKRMWLAKDTLVSERVAHVAGH
jgi:hypothetical protein